MLGKYFSYFDLFKTPIIFYFDGRSKRFSTLGIIISFLIYCFLLYEFIQSDFFKKETPIVVVQSTRTQNVLKIDFDEKKLIYFCVSNSSAVPFVDPTIFNIKAKYYLNATNFTPLTIAPCTRDDVKFNESLYDTFFLKTSFCIKEKNFSLNGDWDENHISYLVVNLFVCDNLTYNGTCKSKEEIDAYFNNWGTFKFFSVKYHNQQVDLYNHDNPFNLAYKTDFQFIDTSFKKRINFFLKTATVETDDGWLFPTSKIDTGITFDSKETDFQMRTDPTQPIFQMLFYASKERIFSTRRYQKLPEALASILGMLNLLTFCFFVSTSLVIHVSTMNSVLNQLYFFTPRIKDKKAHKNSQRMKKMKNSPNLMTETEKNDLIYSKPYNYDEPKKNNLKKSSDEKQLKETAILQDPSKMNSLCVNKEKQSYPLTHDEIIREITVSNLGVRIPFFYNGALFTRIRCN